MLLKYRKLPQHFTQNMEARTASSALLNTMQVAVMPNNMVVIKTLACHG